MADEYLPKFTLKPGDLAPDFTSRIQDGSPIQLHQLKADWIVLFFYPQDLTPTCTTEACNLRDHYGNLRKAGVMLLGISPDDEKKHLKFIAKHELPFDLVADENHEIASAFGVWSKKKFMGRVYDGIHRSTFILDRTFKVREIIYPVQSARHHEQILSIIKQKN